MGYAIYNVLNNKQMKIEILSEPIIEGFGNKLDLALEKKYKVFLQSNADWGYAFKIKMEQIDFDIIVYEVENENKNKILISPDLSTSQKLLKVKYLLELQNLIQIVKDKVIDIQNENKKL